MWQVYKMEPITLVYISLHVLVVAITLFWYLTRHYSYWSEQGISGPKPIVLFGNAITDFCQDKSQIEQEWFNKFGKIYGEYRLNSPRLKISEPELIKKILVKDFDSFMNKGNKQGHHVIDQNLFRAENNEWKRLRTILSPMFTTGKIRQMYPIMSGCVDDMNRVLDGCATSGSHVDIKVIFEKFSTDLIARCSCSIAADVYHSKDNLYVEMSRRVTGFNMTRVFAMMILPRFIRQILKITGEQDAQANEFFVDLAKKMVKEREQNKQAKRDDLFQMLIDLPRINPNQIPAVSEDIRVTKKVKKCITIEEILALTWDFFSANFPMTPSILSVAVHELAINPEVQQRLYDEITGSLGHSHDINFDKLLELEYLNAVISEAFRLHPVVLTLTREATRDYLLDVSGGILIRKGQKVDIPVYAIHHSDEYYPEPNKFDPDRFMPENRAKITPFTYLPFGAGPRVCAANRFVLVLMKLCLAQMVRKYRMIATDRTDIPMRPMRSHLLHSPERVVIRLEKRLY